MFDKIQMTLMMKTTVSNNRISRLNNRLMIRDSRLKYTAQEAEKNYFIEDIKTFCLKNIHIL